ncbi:hypothetical protein HDU76_000244 [Blyttiomyces sp. JEL0837]|nr:hypothetical protein HDU76_000244 [Blyttiomyces sp. JEL0837]
MTSPSSMKALVLVKPSSISKDKKQRRFDPIEIKQVPIPTVPEGHVLVKVNAAALNHRDVYIREGAYPAIVYDSIMGSDCAGVVVKSNPPQSNLVGKSVVINPSVNWDQDPLKPEEILEFGIRGLLPHNGAFAEYISIPIEDVIIKPDHMTHVEAASLPVAAVTAYRATFTLGNLKEGQRVLIPGIGGGVALFALQFAVAVGATVFVTSSSDDKIAKAVALGAAGGVNYKKDTWVADLEAESGGFFDLVVDGAAGQNVKAYARLLAPGGILAVYGAVAGSSGTVNFPYLWFKHLTIKGVCMGSRKEFKEMVEFIGKHKIKPVIAGVFSGLDEAERAFQLMRDGAQFGKIVIRIRGEDAKL